MWEWIVSTYPGGAPPQWWNALRKTAELSVSSASVTPLEQRYKFFERGLCLLEIAVRMGLITRAAGANQLLRMAYMATRLEHQLPELPPPLLPDGAVRYALDSIPISRTSAIKISDQSRVDSVSAGQDFCSRPDFALGSAQQLKKGDAVLMEIGLILEGLALIVTFVVDDELRREAKSWLDIQSRL